MKYLKDTLRDNISSRNKKNLSENDKARGRRIKLDTSTSDESFVAKFSSCSRNNYHATYLKVKVIPKSPKNEIIETYVDEHGDEVMKIRIKAPPEKGKANAELIKFLSKHLSVPKENIAIISGKASRLKLLKVST